jgi:hypothetical protein
VAAVALLGASPVPFRGRRPPTVVPVSGAQAPLVAVAASAQLREPSARTAVVVLVDAAAGGETENASRVAAVRDALRAAAPGAETATRAFATAGLHGALNQLGGRVAVVVPGTAAAAARLVAGAIRPFAFARIQGIENEPADCATARASADASAGAAAHVLARAGAAALGWELGAATVSDDRTVPGNPLESSMLCRGGDAIVSYPLEGGAAADERSMLRASYALAFAARTSSPVPARAAEVARDVDSEPALPRPFPRDVTLVLRQRAITFVGTASAPVAYTGDLVTYASRATDDALPERMRALGLTDVRALVTGDGETMLAVRVPRDGAVTADAVVRALRVAVGDRARNVGSSPYADCTRRDGELVAAAVLDARRRGDVVATALHLRFAPPSALLVTDPVSYTGCASGDAPVRREYTPAAQLVSGAPDRNAVRTVVVAVTYPLQPLAALPNAATTVQPAEDDGNGRIQDDLTPPVRPARALQVATTTAARTLDARRVHLDIRDGPDAANAFRAIDPAAVELAVAPWIAGARADRTHVTTLPRWTPSEHEDVAIGYRLDRVPAGFTDQARTADTVARLAALGYPTFGYVARAVPCRAAADAATVDAVRGALAGGAAPGAIAVGGAVVRQARAAKASAPPRSRGGTIPPTRRFASR